MPGSAELVIERLLDRAVARAMADSPRAAAIVAQLRGKRLAILTRGTPWSIVLESTGRSLRAERAADADATIIGAPLSLLALMALPVADAQALIQRGDVRVEGDTQIAQQFRELGGLLRPDLEAGLGNVIGRSGAHVAMRGMRAAAGWTRRAAWTQLRNLAEYLAHESADLVSRPEAEHYLRGVEQLREQLDRIEARLRLMEQRTQVLTGDAERS